MLQLSDLIIRSHESLRTALERMTRNRKGILFVCDTDEHLIGVLSDGDVRRTLLDDTLLVATVGKTMNTDPITAKTVEEGSALLRRLGLVAVAILGPEGKVTEAVLEDAGEAKVVRHVQEKEPPAVCPAEDRNAVAIIPARGGSKRVPGKNLAVVAGKSLLAWAILAARGARNVGRVIVSTDDPNIADAARALGVEVPWLRPTELARDDSPTLAAVLHALNWSLQALNPAPTYGVLLEPTAPLRDSEHVDQALEALASTGADSVVSVCELPHVFNPEELLVIRNGELEPYLPSRTMDTRKLRGQQPPVYIQSGLVYAFLISSVIEHRSLYGPKTVPLVADWEYFLDIDTPEDLQIADVKIRQRLHRVF